MKENNKILPSLLSANFLNLTKDLDELKKIGIDQIHYDVMDGNFVPNISFGNGILNQLSKGEHFKYDVHLMVNDPEKHIENYINDSVKGITWHHEALTYEEEHKLIKSVRQWNDNLDIGISIKPKTNIEQIYEFLPNIDIILIMSVEPGFGGQKFIEDSLKKIERLRKYIDERNLKTKIYVDGGINDITASQCFNAGADYLVAGSYLFGSKNRKVAVEKLVKND